MKLLMSGRRHICLPVSTTLADHKWRQRCSTSTRDPRQCRAISAGTSPADSIHPEVLAAMQEIGGGASSKPRRLTAELAKTCSVLITMGCGEACPFAPGLKTIQWAIPDPKGQPAEVVRQIRNDIHDKVKALIRSDCAECCQEGTPVT